MKRGGAGRRLLCGADSTYDARACRATVNELMSLSIIGREKAISKQEIGPGSGCKAHAILVEAARHKLSTNNINVVILRALANEVRKGGGRGERSLVCEANRNGLGLWTEGGLEETH